MELISLQPEEEQFKASAVVVDYRTLVRIPDLFLDRVLFFTGRVIRAAWTGGEAELCVEVSGGENASEGRFIFATYNPGDRNADFSENDRIRLWGKMRGLITFASEDGESLTVPRIRAVCIEKVGDGNEAPPS